MLEVVACPCPVSVQDAGRPGFRHLGVPLSGALDAEWLALANALLGNALTAAALEMRLAGPQLACTADTRFAVAGEADVRISSHAGERRVATWRSHRLQAGEVLRIASVQSGVAYLAFAGGIDSRSSLGSRAGYARAGLGEAIGVGTTLKVDAGDTLPLRCLPHPPCSPRRGAAPLRVLPGPQRKHFTVDAWVTLLSASFTVSRAADRMGLRLQGPTLAHVSRAAADIVSEAVTPGTLQVPADGNPIALLADCQTVGGYPQIAVVISADLPQLAHLLPGDTLRFAAVTRDEALAARRAAADALAHRISSIAPLHDGIDLDALYSANLIDGVIHAN